MGKASSNKKVARAAGTGGGRTTTTNAPWTYIALIVGILIVGTALVWSSRSRYESQASAPSQAAAAAKVAPTVGGTAWDEGIGFYVCGHFQPAVKVTKDAEGLTTAGNGVIHIAPTSAASSGANATLGEFAKSVGATLTAKQLRLPGGKTYTNGDSCGGKPAQLFVKTYPYVGAAKGVLATGAAPDVRLADAALVTVAFIAPADKGSIPPPPLSVQQALKIAVTPPTTTTTTTTPTSTTTAKGSSTTTKGSSTTTKASSSTTTKASTTTTKASSSTTTKASKSTGPSGTTTTTVK